MVWIYMRKQVEALKKKEDKTNVMRILDQQQIAYQSRYYYETDAVSGMEVVDVLGENPNQVFKTLVTVGSSQKHYVFLVPVNKSLDLKKAAKVVREKKIELVPTKELLPLTGYVHGGCSPIGMKKLFPTVIDASAQAFATILFSGGKIGYQIEVSLEAVCHVLPVTFADIVEEV